MADRKAKLAALAKKAGRSKTSSTRSGDADAEQQAEEETASVTVSFRNYALSNESLVDQSKDENDDNDGNHHDDDDDEYEPMAKRTKTEKSALQLAVDEAQKEAARTVEQGDITRMGPKKVNADLKRDIQGKLDKLERRTQRAIVSLLKERLEREASQDVPDLD